MSGGLGTRTRSRLVAIACAILLLGGASLAVAGPFGVHASEVAEVEALRTVAEGDEAPAAASPTAALEVAAQTPESAASPERAEAADTPQRADEPAPERAVEPRRLEVAAASEEELPAEPDELQLEAAHEDELQPQPKGEDEGLGGPAFALEPEGDGGPETFEVAVTVDASAAGGATWTRVVTLREGQTAYDALVATGAEVNARATVYGTYVASVNGIAEKEHGPMSGWVYAVDGVEPNVAASGRRLRPGQALVWTYVNVEG